MYIVVGKEDGYIRIIGQGFTVYVNNLHSFHRLIVALHVATITFDDSIREDTVLRNQLTQVINT